MPAPLNSRSGYKAADALVVLRGDDFNRLFAVWQAVTLGHLKVVYAANIPSGFQIPVDLSNPITLVLPPPTIGAIDTSKLGTIALRVCTDNGERNVTLVTHG